MNVHSCSECGWISQTPDRVTVVFHPCRPARERRRLRYLPRTESAAERREADNASWIAGLFRDEEE